MLPGRLALSCAGGGLLRVKSLHRNVTVAPGGQRETGCTHGTPTGLGTACRASRQLSVSVVLCSQGHCVKEPSGLLHELKTGRERKTPLKPEQNARNHYNVYIFITVHCAYVCVYRHIHTCTYRCFSQGTVSVINGTAVNWCHGVRRNTWPDT